MSRIDFHRLEHKCLILAKLISHPHLQIFQSHHELTNRETANTIIE